MIFFLVKPVATSLIIIEPNPRTPGHGRVRIQVNSNSISALARIRLHHYHRPRPGAGVSDSSRIVFQFSAIEYTQVTILIPADSRDVVSKHSTPTPILQSIFECQNENCDHLPITIPKQELWNQLESNQVAVESKTNNSGINFYLSLVSAGIKQVDEPILTLSFFYHWLRPPDLLHSLPARTSARALQPPQHPLHLSHTSTAQSN
jgi:hypothetical protein